ncbi:hypothetical protein WJX79_001400 [Trebouxia sp. C0005]
MVLTRTHHAVFSGSTCCPDNTRTPIILKACAEANKLPQVQQLAGRRLFRRRWPFPSAERVARLRGVPALASSQVQVGDVVQLRCTKLALGARGVCRHVSGLVVFTDALPGEELTARVNKVKKGYAEATKRCNVEVLSIINTVVPPEGSMKYQHSKKASKLKGSGSKRQQSHVLFGSSTITERLCQLDFQISPESFFQVNSAQAEVLYDLVHKAAGLRPTDTVMDLFCGTGSIGLTLAKDCHHVYGFESTASSVADARRNANVNGISNATFVHGDLTKVAAMMGQQYPSPDVIVTDPARSGMSLELIKFQGSVYANEAPQLDFRI